MKAHTRPRTAPDSIALCSILAQPPDYRREAHSLARDMVARSLAPLALRLAHSLRSSGPADFLTLSARLGITHAQLSTLVLFSPYFAVTGGRVYLTSLAEALLDLHALTEETPS